MRPESMLPPVVVLALAPIVLEPEELVSVEPVPLAPMVLPLEPVLPVVLLEPVLPVVPIVLLEPVLPVAPVVLLEPGLAGSFALGVELGAAEPAEPAEPDVCATAMPPNAMAAAAARAVSVCLVVIISYSLNGYPEGRVWKKPASQPAATQITGRPNRRKWSIPDRVCRTPAVTIR